MAEFDTLLCVRERGGTDGWRLWGWEAEGDLLRCDLSIMGRDMPPLESSGEVKVRVMVCKLF